MTFLKSREPPHPPTPLHPRTPAPQGWRAAILGVLALAFYLRLHYLTLFVYHIDEFFTLAAANFIAESGLPRYPTGLFYDPGLPFSYLDGLAFWGLGFSEALGRWPAVIFGVLAVATLYMLGRRILRSPGVGVLAALFLTLNVDSVEWGGRARMISLAQWLVLLSVALLWVGLTRPSARHRLLFILTYGLALLTHFSTIVLLPAWLVAGAGWWRVKRRRRSAPPTPPEGGTRMLSAGSEAPPNPPEGGIRPLSAESKAPPNPPKGGTRPLSPPSGGPGGLRPLLRDALVLLLICGLALASGVIFQPPPSVEFQTADQGLGAKVWALLDKFLEIPSEVGQAWTEYSAFFIDRPHTLLLPFALLGMIVSLVRLYRGGRRPQDGGTLFLGVIFITVMAVLILIIDPHWQRTRYLLMQCLGIFFLLSAHGFREVLSWLPLPAARKSAWRSGLAAIGTLALLYPFLLPLSWSLDAGYLGWNRYDLAFKHARDNMSEGDKVMTMHPPASWLYLRQNDYYLVQSSPKLIVKPDGSLGDRYTGAAWLQTAEAFNQALAGPERVWLMTQEFWLFNSYDGYLQQQILWQMDKLWGEGGVWALASRPGARPLAAEMETPLEAEFANGTRLAGFSAEPFPPGAGEAMQVTLFWGGESIPYQRKVFVHLRDAENNTVAQADHFIYDGKVPSSRWRSLLQNAPFIRDGAALILPPDLPPGTYRLLIGFYHPETFERLGVVDDQSGEAAVVLAEFGVE